MGCDIHFFVEYDRGAGWESADIWEQDDSIEDVSSIYAFWEERDYHLFSLLAGVRRGEEEDPPIDSARGLPRNISPKVQANYNHLKDDAHNESWYLLRELYDKRKRIRQACPEFLACVRRMEMLAMYFAGDDFNKVRCVFWFDN